MSGQMKKLLVANRGEIARRIFRSAKALGIATVAVYSEADAQSAHVADSDEAYAIGRPPARESYLNVERILQVVRESGADTVHPGYGFLSESAEFAETIIAAGLTWVGPTPQSIRDMGDKQRARDLAAAAGVPIVPGTGRFSVGDIEEVAEAAEKVGYPLLVKAVAGGGGIGMRRVDRAEQLVDTVTATQSMAEKAFGDGAVFLERFVPKARHVEVQVFGFGDGTAIHLHERDCSLQRRFQKVIEESPAPGLPAAVREKMTAAAVALCRKTSYSGAGTIEFIVDADSFDFFFLEMNTRIQVEHPVTEMVTGLDLVAMQIGFARGALSSLAQEAVHISGHAIECRLYAEDPAKMFMPSPGRLATFCLPEAGRHVRVDSGYREGDVVSPFYDPMIAKLIVWGVDRDDARKRACEALRTVSIEGLRTNRDFLIACMEDETFAAGDVYTSFIDDHRKILITA